ncbi:hypothetical protein NC653_026516 [Populus alba x Populus x berolinensis]|uniref:Uncharacterized protein n=1 Tax=Populus alba x Populus x berolinensis TaxID=444605 RepID=A0AAD6Q923_9ROSI|nr:hypothetical protein NC653_026516 [Populus alba x Populus x berolinensis]
MNCSVRETCRMQQGATGQSRLHVWSEVSRLVPACRRVTSVFQGVKTLIVYGKELLFLLEVQPLTGLSNKIRNGPKRRKGARRSSGEKETVFEVEGGEVREGSEELKRTRSPGKSDSSRGVGLVGSALREASCTGCRRLIRRRVPAGDGGVVKSTVSGSNSSQTEGVVLKEPKPKGDGQPKPFPF